VGSVNELDTWIAAACVELGLHPDDIKAKSVLDVARDVAHRVIRPGAPVSAYLMGVAVGRGADPSDVAARLSALALSWPKENAEPAEGRAEPAEGRAEPAEGTAEPAEGTAEPAEGTAEPAGGRPEKPNEKPARPDETPEDPLSRAKESRRTS
jgi:hypothetical protein